MGAAVGKAEVSGRELVQRFRKGRVRKNQKTQTRTEEGSEKKSWECNEGQVNGGP